MTASLQGRSAGATSVLGPLPLAPRARSGRAGRPDWPARRGRSGRSEGAKQRPRWQGRSGTARHTFQKSRLLCLIACFSSSELAALVALSVSWRDR